MSAGGALTRARERGRVEHCENCEGRRRRLQSHLGTFRARSRVTSRQVQGKAIKGGNLFIDAFRVPEISVSPSGSVEVDVTVGNKAQVVLPLDDDFCTPSAAQVGPSSGGYKYAVTIDPEWTTSTSRTGCVPTATAGLGTEQHTAEFQSPPTSGAFTITVVLEARGSGETISVQRNIIVEEQGSLRPPAEGQPDPGGGGDDSRDGPGPLLPCVLDPNRDCSPGELAGIGGVLVAFVVLLAR